MSDDRSQTDRQRLRERYAACVCMGLRDDAKNVAQALDITPAEMDAHFRARHHALDEWVPDDFESFASLPPGRFDPRVLEQTTWWVDILRRPHRITDPEDFTTEHLRAVIGYIRAEAWRWVDPSDLVGVTSRKSFHDECAGRIGRTPLMCALLAEAGRRMLG